MKFNIEGFDSMTTEEKLAALQDAVDGYNPEDNGFIAKATFDKTASQLSESKKQARDAQAAVKTAQDNAKTLEDRIAELEKIGKISDAKAKYLALGYADELATSSAKALIDNDMDTLFANQKTFNESVQQMQRQKSLTGMTQPSAGQTGQPAVNYDSLIANAQAMGNFSEVAYYTRLKESASHNS